MWSIVSNFLNEAKKKGKEKLSFRDLLPKLNALESSIGEEYYIFVQMKTLQLMVKEINQLYNINLESIKKVFESIIKDEEHHRELLATIKDLISDKPKKHDNTAKVKYQNPDSWISPLPPETYDWKWLLRLARLSMFPMIFQILRRNFSSDFLECLWSEKSKLIF